MSETSEMRVQIDDAAGIGELILQEARDRALSKDEVYELIEEALAWVLKRNNNREGEFRVTIGRETHDLQAVQLWEVISDDEPIEDVSCQKTYEVACEIDAGAEIGGEVSKAVAAPDISKHANAQIFKQKYISCRRRLEHNKMLDELLERGETLVNGTVKRIDRASGDFVIEIQRVECRLRRQDSIPRESLRIGDRLRCLIVEVKEDPYRGRIVYLSRTSDDFLRELFRREVPEIEKGILDIVAVSRDPGFRSKIAVRSRDSKVDPVGTCVGMRGSRVQSVTADLGGEKVDIVPWEEDEINFVINALAPAEISSVRVLATKVCDVIVEEEKLAQAIGKGGTNVKLASRLTGWQINITNAQDAEERELVRVERKQNYFMERLDVDESIARILYDEGFNTIDEIKETSREELLEIEGFDDGIVDAIIQRTAAALTRAASEYKEKLAKAEQGLKDLVPDEEILRSLVGGDILSLEALAEYGTEDLLEVVGDITEDEAAQLITSARERCGWFDEPDDQEGDA